MCYRSLRSHAGREPIAAPSRIDGQFAKIIRFDPLALWDADLLGDRAVLTIPRPAASFHEELGRRNFLRIGGLATLGVTLPGLLRARESTSASAVEKRGKAKSCIFIFLQGGPAHQDTFDPKPDAAVEYRGEFKAIATNVPGTLVCEHLPRLARLADRYALIRSCYHDDPEHNSAAYACLTGRMHPDKGRIVGPSVHDFPPYGAVVAKVRPPTKAVPAWVTMPAYLINSGVPFPSQNAGFLGGPCEPLAIRSDPNGAGFVVEGLDLSRSTSRERFDARRNLWQQLDELARRVDAAAAVQIMDTSYQRAFDLIFSPDARGAFRLSAEAAPVRERYGRTPFGQSVLLSRRLVEAGVPLVTVYYTSATPRRPGCSISWDTHEDNFPDLKNKLLPDLDRALSALLEDLEQRGLLSETLVVAAGEFGRTPRVGQQLTNAGSTANGRDHWTRCYSVLWAGGGVHGGLVYGASDKKAAYPALQPVTPADLAASLYHALGVDPHLELSDREGRRLILSPGEPILSLFA